MRIKVRAFRFGNNYGVETRPIIALALPGENVPSNPFDELLCCPPALALPPIPALVNTAVSEWNNAFMSNEPSCNMDIKAAEFIPSDELRSDMSEEREFGPPTTTPPRRSRVGLSRPYERGWLSRGKGCDMW